MVSSCLVKMGKPLLKLTDKPSNKELNQLANYARLNHIRVPIVLTNSSFNQIIANNFSLNNTLTVSQHDCSHYQKFLGREHQHLIINYHSNLSANMLFALFSTVIAGGFIFLLVDTNNADNKPFSNYLLNKLACIQATILEKSYCLFNGKDNSDGTQFQINEEQQSALKALIAANKPSIITGKRGCGKSSLLGLAINHLIKAGQTILFSAPSRQSANNVFKQVDQLQNVSRETFYYCPPEKLLELIPQYDYCVIDEAASLPTTTLKTVLVRHQKTILATTIEGYEGQGEGFRLNYLEKYLDKNNIIEIIRLNKSYRYSANDPIEKLFHALYSTEKQVQNPIYNPLFDLVDGNHQVDFNKLNEIQQIAMFSHLKSAHYRTTPNDFAHLINGMYQLFITVKSTQLVAVCQLLKEEIINTALVEEVILGNRRPSGSLTLQSLLQSHDHAATPLSKLNIVRVIRIAVIKNQQRNGIASQLLEYVENYLQSRGVDIVSAAYSGSHQNINFWNRNQYFITKIGVKPDKWNGNFPIVSLKALQPAYQTIIDELSSLTNRHLQFYTPYLYPKNWANEIIKYLRTNTNYKQMPKSQLIYLLNSNKGLIWLAPSIVAILTNNPMIDDSIKKHYIKRLQHIISLTKSQQNQLKTELKKLI